MAMGSWHDGGCELARKLCAGWFTRGILSTTSSPLGLKLPDNPEERRQVLAGGPGISSLAAATLPWAFIQHHPLDTESFTREAAAQGFRLDAPTLRELCRHQLLCPLIQVTAQPAGPTYQLDADQPQTGTTFFALLYQAALHGCWRDPLVQPTHPRLTFEALRQPQWNGLLYAYHQLLVLPDLRDYIGLSKRFTRNGRVMVRLPSPTEGMTALAMRYRRIAVALTALEARYYPVLDPEWVQLRGVRDAKGWERYRAGFSPAAASLHLGYSADQALSDAEQMLRYSHFTDPAKGDLRKLLRRIRRDDKASNLSGELLWAMEHREAAEILLCFHEDLAPREAAQQTGALDPLHERLSYRDRTLDEELMDLGMSPYPRVVLAVEGDTEETLVPLVWRALDYPLAPELMRVLNMGGSSKELTKIAALAAAPIVSGQPYGRPAWSLRRPPARLVVAMDPENNLANPEAEARVRTQLIQELKQVLKGQGVARPDSMELRELVRTSAWSGGCFEFAHFSNYELAEAIERTRGLPPGKTSADLVARLQVERSRGRDVHHAYSDWPREYQPTKRDLAANLWPVLKRDIERYMENPRARHPDIVKVLQGAYATAQRLRYVRFALPEEPEGMMTAEDVCLVLDLLRDLRVWIDGGWGVDALLCEQTRHHSDLDIAVQVKDDREVRSRLAARGFAPVSADDPLNHHLLADQAGRKVDIHLVDLQASQVKDVLGHAAYGPPGLPYELDFKYTLGEGVVGSNKGIRCCTPTHHLYRLRRRRLLKSEDYDDALALGQRYGMEVPMRLSWRPSSNRRP
jgi:hypothetical protein